MDEIEKIEEKIDLAISANGGEIRKKEWCQCDPSVGYSPCEYCAIFNGLIGAKSLLSEVKRLQGECRVRQVAVDRWVPCPDHRDKTERDKCYICEIETLEREKKELERQLESSNQIRKAEKKILIQEVARKKELEEGIEKHRDAYIALKDGRPRYNRDKELYKLIEGVEKD